MGDPMFAGFDRDSDIEEPANNRVELTLPLCISENEMIERLIAMTAQFNATPSVYEQFPEDDGDGDYNSNGFISGIGVAADRWGMPAPGNTGANTPGHEHPVPPHYFFGGGRL